MLKAIRLVIRSAIFIWEQKIHRLDKKKRTEGGSRSRSKDSHWYYVTSLCLTRRKSCYSPLCVCVCVYKFDIAFSMKTEEFKNRQRNSMKNLQRSFKLLLVSYHAMLPFGNNRIGSQFWQSFSLRTNGLKFLSANAKKERGLLHSVTAD